MPELTDAQVESDLLRLDVHGNGTSNDTEKGRGRGFGDDDSENSTARGSPRPGDGSFGAEVKADRAADQNPMLKS